MDLGDLIVEARVRADDNVAPYLTDDETFARWASEAEREACVRARLLFQSAPLPGITLIPLVIGVAEYQLSPLIHWIDAASFVPVLGRAKNLDLIGLDSLREYCDWETRTSSTPWALTENGASILRVFPAPSVIGTLRLTVYRLPLYPMESMDDEPEINPLHHEGLVDWMLYRYWSQKDSENYDQERASQALSDFEVRFGKRNSADVMRKHRERRRITTRYGGY